MISFLKSLIYGNAASHLYFIVLIIQLYLLFPILDKWVKKTPVLTQAISFLISAVFSKLVYIVPAEYIPVISQANNIFPFWKAFPTWLFYFVLGMFAVRINLEKIISFGEKYLYVLTLISILCAVWFSYRSYLTGCLDAIKLELFVYTPLIGLTILGAGRKLRSKKSISKSMTFTAYHSQTVYFSHILILEILRKLSVFSYGMRGMLLLLVVETAVSIAFAWFFDKTLKLIADRIHRSQRVTQ